MSGSKDFYTLLSVPRNATTDQLRRAYRQAAMKLHPDRNQDPGETELFLRISQAYETLMNEGTRAEYDQQLAEQEELQAETASIRCDVIHSRTAILRLDEPQVHYTLLDIHPRQDLPYHRPPVNLAIVIDRSTSMDGPRLDQVRSATLHLLRGLAPTDSAVVVAFSDRADVIVTPGQAHEMSTARARLSLLQADGGTEIGQGLRLGLQELQKSFSHEGVNHLILLTDGRTYGDEDECLMMASNVADSGITINGVGIGSDWSDRFLDELSARTGGSVLFLDTPKAITGLLENILDSLSQVVASKVRLEGSFSNRVDLRAAFRLLPEPMVLGDTLPLALGNLPRGERIQVLMEMVIHPIGALELLEIGHLKVRADLLSERATEASKGGDVPLSISLPLTDQPDSGPPPDSIVEALGSLSLYRMQDKARHDAELGNTRQAAQKLENLATQLLAGGQRDLAKAALAEAENLAQMRRISTEGEKVLKYGTRALLLPARSSASEGEDD